MAGNGSFFRKVVRFVANPTTDWKELDSRVDESVELEKSELKAMIERRRRNDFVRKREFDMLRKVRREGLSPEQLAALGSSSRLDDSESRPSDTAAPTAAGGVKAKIDAIEQQMVGDGALSVSTRSPAEIPVPVTRPGPLPATPPANLPGHPPVPAAGADDDEDAPLPALPPLPDLDRGRASPSTPMVMGAGLPPLTLIDSLPASAAAASSPAAADPSRPAAAAARGPSLPSVDPAGAAGAVEVNEIVHDPELDEAVISFANADFVECERLLGALIEPGGPRVDHTETWLALADLYRATGQSQRFETLAVDFAERFERSPPPWFSLPQLVADALAEEMREVGTAASSGTVAWICSAALDVEGVAQLRSQTLQLPSPWVFDWGALRRIEPEAAMQLSTLFRVWANQRLEMRWIQGDRLFRVLREAAPSGVREADPVFWLARLDGLRLINRNDKFDEAAMDYCVTYEVSPPSWEPPRCDVVVVEPVHSTQAPALSVISGVSTSFLDSGTQDGAGGGIEVAHVELSGQLSGDISATLERLAPRLGMAPLISVSCARLIRVDFIAAGDLLNWVLARAHDGKLVHFVDAHRLLALFFGAMGISEHAKVRVRKS